MWDLIGFLSISLFVCPSIKFCVNPRGKKDVFNLTIYVKWTLLPQLFGPLYSDSQLDQNQFWTFCQITAGSSGYSEIFLGKLQQPENHFTVDSAGWGVLGFVGVIIAISLAGIPFGHYWVRHEKMSTFVAF